MPRGDEDMFVPSICDMGVEYTGAVDRCDCSNQCRGYRNEGVEMDITDAECGLRDAVLGDRRRKVRRYRKDGCRMDNKSAYLSSKYLLFGTIFKSVCWKRRGKAGYDEGEEEEEEGSGVKLGDKGVKKRGASDW